MRGTLWVAALLVPGALWADRVTLKNGDRLSGEILVLDAASVLMKTEFLGEVKIDRAAVVAIETERPLSVTLKTGERLEGEIAIAESAARVRKADQTEMRVPAETLEAARTRERQAAWEREQRRRTNPPLLDFWAGSISLGLATARGNARTTTLSSGATAQRVTGFDKIGLRYSQIYSTQSTRAPFGVTANRVSGAARYDRDFGGRLFTYSSAQFDFDEFQDLDLRSVLGGGLGYHVFKSERSFLNIDVGGAWNREKFSTGLVRNSGEVVIGEESRHQLTESLRIFQSLTVNPNLSETGQYRLAFDGGVTIQLNRFLSLNVTLADRYLSNPLPGNRKNDVLLTTGVSFTFEQK